MLDFIVKYWLETVFGLIATGLGFLCRYFYKQMKKEQSRKETEFQNNLRKDIEKAIAQEHEKTIATITAEVGALTVKDNIMEARLNTLLDNMTTVKTGLLSVQGQAFKTQCRELLKSDHEITLPEFEQLSSDHNAYNLLGGNHEGDQLFSLVELKYENSITGK